MRKGARIYLAGHRGLVGSAIKRQLDAAGQYNIICRTSKELDLRNQQATELFFKKEQPEYVFLCAAKVGGILANSNYPVDFIYDNLAIQNNIINLAYKYGVKKLLFLGSSCIYPKFAPQPIKEDSLLTGALEPTNEYYALAKIAGLKMCEAYNKQYNTNFISVMPTNLYGPNDNFDLEDSHVLPALIRKFHEAKIHNMECVEIWGSGLPKREFLYVDDLAEACVMLMEKYNWPELKGTINIGTGEDISINELALMLKEIVGFQGIITYSPEKPDGTPRKLLDISKIRSFSWYPKTSLYDGIKKTYLWYCNSIEEDTGASQ